MENKSVVLLRKGQIAKSKFQTRNNLYEFDFGVKKGKYLNKGQIERIANKYVEKIKTTGINFKVQVSIRYDGLPKGKFWKFGHSTTLDEPVETYDAEIMNSDKNKEEVELINSITKFRRFKVLFWESSKAGGCSENTMNDCLFIALELSGIKLPSVINSGSKLKKHFGLGRKDRFPISKLNNLSKLIKYNINLVGDEVHIYGQFKKTIHLKLTNNHYILKHKDSIVGVKNLSKKPKEIIYVYDEYSKELYPPIEDDVESFVQECINKKKFGDNLIIHCNKEFKKLMNLSKDASLKDVYDRFILIANNIKESSEGKIDLYICGSSFKNYALHLLNKSLKVEYESEPIDETENKFINSGGGFLYARNGYEGECIEYDLNWAFQSAMLHNNFSFPSHKPSYEIYNMKRFEDDGFFPFGEYICEIRRSGIYEKDSLFTFRKRDNVYTHYDLTRAYELGLEIVFNEDECNCALYRKERIHGKEFFGSYFDMIKSVIDSDKLIDEAKDVVKLLRNILHGALSQRNFQYAKPDETGKTEFEFDDNDVEGIEPQGDEGDTYEVKYIPKSQPFTFNYARLLPFLNAFVRNHISRTIEKIGLSCVVRSHTDSIFTIKPIESLEMGNDIGQWKIKKQQSIKITNINKFEWV